MSYRKTIHDYVDYVAADDDKPPKEVEQRFAKLRAEVFDSEGRLRATFRPSTKPASPKKAATSLFAIDMDSNSGALPPHLA